MFIRIFLIFAAIALANAGWERMPGAAVEISVKGNELWALANNNECWRWNGRLSWVRINSHADHVAASVDGYTWATDRNQVIWRYNVTIQNWEKMPGNLIQIGAVSKDSAIGIANDQSIWYWNGQSWTKQPGAAVWAAIGEQDERWVIANDQSIYRWSGSTWVRMPGAAVNIDVHDPSRIVITTAANKIYVWKKDHWVEVPGIASKATINRDYIYVVNKNQEIYVLDAREVFPEDYEGRPQQSLGHQPQTTNFQQTDHVGKGSSGKVHSQGQDHSHSDESHHVHSQHTTEIHHHILQGGRGKGQHKFEINEQGVDVGDGCFAFYYCGDENADAE